MTYQEFKDLRDLVARAAQKRAAERDAAFSSYRECSRCWLLLPRQEFRPGRRSCRDCEAVAAALARRAAA
jgi:hypothetical protein